MTDVSVIALSGLGAAVGALLPWFAEQISRYKYRQKDQILQPKPIFTAWWVLLLCALVNGGFWGLCWQLASPLMAVLAMLVGGISLVLLLTDLRVRLIPNLLLAPLVLIGVAFRVLIGGAGSLIPAFFSTVMVMVVFLMLGEHLGLSTIGAGDVKLAGVMALTLGFPAIMTSLGIMAVTLLAFCGIGLLLKKLTLRSMLPFGPFLVPGFLGGMLFLLYTI